MAMMIFLVITVGVARSMMMGLIRSTIMMGVLRSIITNTLGYSISTMVIGTTTVRVSPTMCVLFGLYLSI
jgi:hypothetical protein